MKVILVLTPGRTGSSMLTGILRHLGVWLGACNSYNEHAQIEFLLKEISNAATIDDKWAVAKGWSMERADPDDVDKMRRLLMKELETSPLVAIKNPKLFYMMPLVRAVLGSIGVPWCVLLSRRKREHCVNSMVEGWSRAMRGREGCDGVYSFFERETQMIRDVPVASVWFHELLGDWESAMTRVGSELDIDWPVPIEEARQSINDFIDPSMVHFA